MLAPDQTSVWKFQWREWKILTSWLQQLDQTSLRKFQWREWKILTWRLQPSGPHIKSTMPLEAVDTLTNAVGSDHNSHHVSLFLKKRYLYLRLYLALHGLFPWGKKTASFLKEISKTPTRMEGCRRMCWNTGWGFEKCTQCNRSLHKEILKCVPQTGCFK